MPWIIQEDDVLINYIEYVNCNYFFKIILNNLTRYFMKKKNIEYLYQHYLNNRILFLILINISMSQLQYVCSYWRLKCDKINTFLTIKTDLKIL